MIGDYIALIGFALWFCSGIAFPLCLAIAEPYDPEKMKFYIYFFFSQIAYGLIASTETFFLMTFFSVRSFHPMLVQLDQPDLEDGARLLRLDRRVVWYLAMAIAAPLLAVVTVTFMKFNASGDLLAKWATGALALIGIFSSWCVFRLLRAIQDDIAAIMTAVDPERATTPTVADSIDSFWSSSR